MLPHDNRAAQPIAFAFECSFDGWQNHESETWGACRQWIEVGEDQLATRQIEAYVSGPVLVYDRAFPRDRFGMLVGLRFSRKDKWQRPFTNVRKVSQGEFERVWRRLSPSSLQRSDPGMGAPSGTT